MSRSRELATALVGVACALSCGRFEYEAYELPDAALTVDWVTPNSVRWTWTASDDADIVAYEFALATDRDELVSGDRIVFSSSQNPELGWLDDDTITDQLEPDTIYYGQLAAVLSNGARATSKVVEVATGPAHANEIVLFQDAPTDGYSIPSDFVHSDSGARTGTHCYAFVQSCDDGEAECFENLRRQGVSFDLSVIPSELFAAAVFEFSIAADGPIHSRFTQARLMMRDIGNDQSLVFSTGGFSHRADGTYRTYQIPLGTMTVDDQPLTPAVASARELFEWGVGGSWGNGATVRMDDVSIRY